jgi:hypothetical protein
MTEELKVFIKNTIWTFAKTMPKWPHEYIVRKNVDEKLFVLLVECIRNNGYLGHFYKKEITYYDYKEYTYWTMGAPIAETTIVNRALLENSYENRLKNGTLPEEGRKKI